MRDRSGPGQEARRRVDDEVGGRFIALLLNGHPVEREGPELEGLEATGTPHPSPVHRHENDAVALPGSGVALGSQLGPRA